MLDELLECGWWATPSLLFWLKLDAFSSREFLCPMLQQQTSRTLGGLALLALPLAGCAGTGPFALDDRECMIRVMYFESNRSSEEGMLAVGTTVMNRLNNPKYPKTVCGVVGQRNQFAPGVLSNPMVPRLAARVARVADRVLAGERHPQVGNAMFFHTVGYSFPYNNMNYVAVAGGNAFYSKVPTTAPQRTMVAAAEPVYTQPSSFAPMTSVPMARMPIARPSPKLDSRPQSIEDLLAQPAAPSSSRLQTASGRFDETGVY